MDTATAEHHEQVVLRIEQSNSAEEGSIDCRAVRERLHDCWRCGFGQGAGGSERAAIRQIANLTAARMAQTRPLDDAKKKIMAWWAGPISAYERAKVIFDRKILTYNNEQERIRVEQQRKADEAARKERERLQRGRKGARKRER